MHTNLREPVARPSNKLCSGLGEKVKAKAEKQWRNFGSVNASSEDKTWEMKPGHLCSLVHHTDCGTAVRWSCSTHPQSQDDLPVLTVSVLFTGVDGTSRPSWRLSPCKYRSLYCALCKEDRELNKGLECDFAGKFLVGPTRFPGTSCEPVNLVRLILFPLCDKYFFQKIY